MTDRERELEAQAAALRAQVQRIRQRVQAQYDHDPNETTAWILDCTAGVCAEMDTALALDTARDWLADARVMAKAGHELLCWATCHHLVNWKAAPWEALHAALSRARARGWLED